MPMQALIDLVEANNPLVEATISLIKDFNGETVWNELNQLTDDFEASLSVYCKQTEQKDLLTIDATPEALKKIFGWEIKRIPGRNWNYQTQQFEETVKNLYVWEEVNRPTKLPRCLEGKVKGIGLSQPGGYDNTEQDYP